MEETPDYNVKIIVRNGKLIAKMREAGYDTVAAFCRAFDLGQTHVQSVVNLRVSGMKKLRPEWRGVIVEIADALNCAPEDFIPAAHWHEALAKNTFELPMTGDEARQLVHHGASPDFNLNKADVRRLLDERLSRLSKRAQKVMRMRFGLNPDTRPMTGSEISEKMKISRGRVQQIEARALELLVPRDHGEQNELRSYLRDFSDS